jgi:hypothetical protein
LYGFLEFTRRVFRPGDPLVERLTMVTVVLLLLPGLVQAFVPTQRTEVSASAFAANAARGIPFLWAFVECTRYRALMRRRERLGLADPLVVNRFSLWMVWTGALALLSPAILGVRTLGWLARRAEPGSDPGAWGVPLAGGIAIVLLTVAAVGVGLSFFPPERYRHWIRRRATSGA